MYCKITYPDQSVKVIKNSKITEDIILVIPEEGILIYDERCGRDIYVPTDCFIEVTESYPELEEVYLFANRFI